MSTPSITYRHGKLWDGDDISDWNEYLNGSTGSLSSFENDFFLCQLTAFSADAYWTNNTPLNLSTLQYPKIRYRYKTTGNAKAKIVAHFSDSSTQVILSETANSALTSGVETLTATKMLNFISIYCCDGVGEVLYDYVLIYAGDFVFPNCRHGIDLYIPTEENHEKPIGMTGQLTDGGGCNLAYYEVLCDLTKGTWKRSSDHIDGEVFAEIAHRSGQELWQWFDAGNEKMKVRIENLHFPRSASPETLTRVVSFILREFRLSDALVEEYNTRWGMA